ncbi:MAG: hypothetical protein LBB66_06440, partial [Desulfovibrio sp.]|nr:hypothetical protein [Desulfovibrio sp.]
MPAPMPYQVLPARLVKIVTCFGFAWTEAAKAIGTNKTRQRTPNRGIFLIFRLSLSYMSNNIALYPNIPRKRVVGRFKKESRVALQAGNQFFVHSSSARAGAES